MPNGFDSPMMSPWEQEGQRQALALDDAWFVLIIGDDPAAAAEVALGIGRVQAGRRRVVVADAVGLLGPIDDLVPFDSPLGISDVFIKGTPLDEAVHVVESPQNLGVLPSGGGKLDPADLMANERWMQIADDFRTAGSLLMVVVPMKESAVEFLVPHIDGVVLVGKAQPLPGVRVLAYVSGPAASTAQPPRPSRSVPAADDFDSDLPPLPDFPATRQPPRPGAIRRVTEAGPRPSTPQKRTRTWVVVIWAIALAAEGVWYFTHHKPGGSQTIGDPVPAAADSDSVSAGDDSTGVADSTGPVLAPVVAPSGVPAPTDSAPAGTQRPELAAMVAKANAAKADSDAKSAAFSVELLVLPSATAANARLATDPIKDLPALTVSPHTEPDGSHTFHVIAGAFNKKEEADSLLAALVKGGVVIAGQGKVVRLPFAVVVQSGVTRDEASLLGTGYRGKGLAVYSLALPDGRVRMYIGAYERAADAALQVASLRVNNERPSVTYRIGRLP
jgi:hypothetical protein